jgi:hypothetical protein
MHMAINQSGNDSGTLHVHDLRLRPDMGAHVIPNSHDASGANRHSFGLRLSRVGGVDRGVIYHQIGRVPRHGHPKHR